MNSHNTTTRFNLQYDTDVWFNSFSIIKIGKLYAGWKGKETEVRKVDENPKYLDLTATDYWLNSILQLVIAKYVLCKSFVEMMMENCSTFTSLGRNDEKYRLSPKKEKGRKYCRKLYASVSGITPLHHCIPEVAADLRSRARLKVPWQFYSLMWPDRGSPVRKSINRV